ncbi:MAG: rhomboid family intramembrane serine protease [Planctomycetota bacterium]|jgi:membrane associated rhomboid family serine protease
MGLYDRDYTQADYRPQYRYGPQMRMGLPKITPVVKWLLIINVVVHFMQILTGDGLMLWFSVHPVSPLAVFQLWRLVTYQFLHGDLWHIIFNMIVLYFLGSTLERHWGSKKFLLFYLCCGMVGGLVYPLLLALKIISPHPVHGVLPLVGASGAILGVLATCAILFPNIVMIFYFFPLPIRVVAIILTLIAVYGIITGENAGGEAAHLAGMAAGAIYVLSQPWQTKLKVKLHTGRGQKKIAEQRNLQLEIDRILQKVHESGLQSLTSKEKKLLKKATEAEQMRKGPQTQ